VDNVALAGAIDHLPRALAVWHDGRATLSKLLTHCTLQRLYEEAELLRSGIGPGLPRPDAEVEDSAYTEHRDRWRHAVATIVEWHGELCLPEQSLVPIPPPPRNLSNRGAAKRHKRNRPRRVSDRDYLDAVALASDWAELDPIRVGLRTGDMEVAKASGRHVWIANLRRADVEALDIFLAFVTLPGSDGVEHEGPDLITKWFVSNSLAEPDSHGLPPRHPSAFTLLNSLPSHLRLQAWTETETGLRRQGATVADDLDLGGITFADSRTCYAFLLSQIHLNRLGAFHFSAPEAMLWAIRPSNLERALAQRVSRSAARAFIEMCTFSRGRSPVSAPLVPNGEFILIPSEIVSPIAYERTLLRAASANPSKAGQLGNVLGDRALRWAQRLRAIPGCLTAEGVRIKDTQGRTVGDLDVVAWDPNQRLMVVIETKWPVDAATLAESFKVDAMFDKGADQLRRLRSVLNDGSAIVNWPSTWQVPPDTTWSWWVGSAQQLDSRQPRQPDDIGTTSLRLVEHLLPARDLLDLTNRMAAVSLPKRGLDWDLEPRAVSAGHLTLHYDALGVLGSPQAPPPERRIHNGWT
jgi:hypothetical protein